MQYDPLSLGNDKFLQVGKAHLRARRWREAEALSSHWLQRQPGNAEAMAIRAMVGLANGQAEAAQELIYAALVLDSQSGFIYFALAQLYLSQSKSEQAESSVRRSLRLAPEDVDANCLLASLLIGRNEQASAEQQLRNALLLVPEGALLYLALAELLPPNQLEVAVGLTATGLGLDPSIAQGWLLAAKFAVQQGQWMQARQYCEQSLLLEPDNPAFLTELARVLLLASFPQGAQSQTLLLQAENSARQALVLMPQSFSTQLILGAALRSLGRTDEALELQAGLVRLAPQDPVPVLEIALTQREAGRLDAALLAAEHAIALSPELPQAHLLKSDILMRQGEWSRAFAAFDRLDCLLRTDIARLPAPCTKESLANTTILLHSQSMADVLLFARYVPMLTALGAQVSIAADPQLYPILQTLAGLCELLPLDTKQQGYDYVETMQRLPVFFPTLLDTNTVSTRWAEPYCQYNSDDLEQIKEQFAALPARRIGLHLGPNPDAVLAAMLVAMFSTLDVTLVILSALAPLEPLFDELSVEFAHTNHPATLANLVLALDSVLCVDSLVAHIAGAIGAECHLLLPLQHESLWCAVGENTIWYPSMRLYRQSRQDDWKPAVDALKIILMTSLGQDPS